MSYNDTIAAISTAPGGAIGIVRLSGGSAVDIVSKFFKGIKSLENMLGYTGTLGKVYDVDGSQIDEAIAFVYRAPNSYTGEDICELSMHGGQWVLQRALELAIHHGARQAKAGEFTRRAFVAGKLTMQKAEGVLGLVSATTRGEALGAMRLLEGENARQVQNIADSLMNLCAHITAVIDYPDEGVEELLEDEIKSVLDSSIQSLDRLIDQFSRSRLVSTGVRVAIAGTPNVGKSTLLNLLTGEQTAIVSSIAGTTRDILECSIAISGYKFILNDTAGLHSSEDEIERIGIARAKNRIQQCDIVLMVLDGSRAINADDADIIAMLGNKPIIAVINKADLSMVLDISELKQKFTAVVPMSAMTGEGREHLEHSLIQLSGLSEASSAIMCSARQLECAANARSCINTAVKLLKAGEGVDIISIELEQALANLLAIEGKNATDEMLDRLFENFCVGK